MNFSAGCEIEAECMARYWTPEKKGQHLSEEEEKKVTQSFFRRKRQDRIQQSMPSEWDVVRFLARP